VSSSSQSTPTSVNSLDADQTAITCTRARADRAERGVSTLFASLPAEHDEREGTTMAIGLALLTGFALMLM
jgi:hypothetical protein